MAKCVIELDVGKFLSEIRPYLSRTVGKKRRTASKETKSRDSLGIARFPIMNFVFPQKELVRKAPRHFRAYLQDKPWRIKSEFVRMCWQ